MITKLLATLPVLVIGFLALCLTLAGIVMLVSFLRDPVEFPFSDSWVGIIFLAFGGLATAGCVFLGIHVWTGP